MTASTMPIVASNCVMTSAAVLAKPQARRMSSKGTKSSGAGTQPPSVHGRTMALTMPTLEAHSFATVYRTLKRAKAHEEASQ